MTGFLNFLGNNYLILILITFILILALVGYFVNIKKSKQDPYKIDSNNLNQSIIQNNSNIQMNNQSEIDTL